jgi:metal-sulfur cluster biosynthetic enzyme
MVAASPVEREVWRLLADVPDPEIPILNVIELGVVRYVRDDHERGIAVGVSPRPSRHVCSRLALNPCAWTRCSRRRGPAIG